MTEESIEFLKGFLKEWEVYKMVKVWPHLATEDSKRMLEIAKEVDPTYSGTVWCQSCLEDVVKFVFKAYERETINKVTTITASFDASQPVKPVKPPKSK